MGRGMERPDCHAGTKGRGGYWSIGASPPKVPLDERQHEVARLGAPIVNRDLQVIEGSTHPGDDSLDLGRSESTPTPNRMTAALETALHARGPTCAVDVVAGTHVYRVRIHAR